ncbi:MAG: PilN domain-containing protein [Myxococcota bacterium]
MIQINLLPVREAKRAADLRQHVTQLAITLLLVAVTIWYVHDRITDQISVAEQRVAQMEADIEKFKPQLQQVEAFRKKKASLERKIDIIEGLDRARQGPVRVMDELATHTPERLWLDNVETKGTTISLSGRSLDNELVAVFLGSLGDSPYFSDVDLDSTELAKGPDGLKVVKFKIQASVVTPPKNAQS